MEADGEEVAGDADDVVPPGALVGEELLQRGGQLVEEEEEMLGGSELGGVPAQPALRFPQLSGFQDPSAPIALIPPRGRGAAVWAGADDIPVREEPVVVRTVRVLIGPAGDVPVLEQRQEQLLDGPLVDRGVGMREQVELDPQRLKDRLVLRVELLEDRLRRRALLLRRHEDRGPMGIGAAHHEHVVARQAPEPGEDVGRKVDPGESADVDLGVGVGPCHADEYAAHRRSSREPYQGQ